MPLRRLRPAGSNRPRVVHVYKDVYPPVAGGIERHIDTLRHALPDMQHDVLACSRGPATIRRDGPDGSLEVLVGEWGRVLSTPMAPTFPYWLARMARGAIVHLHSPQPVAECSSLVAGTRSPLVFTHHADVFRQRWLLGAYAPLVAHCMRRADVVITGSERLRTDSVLIKRAGVDARVVPYGIDTARFSTGRADEVLVDQLRARYGARHVLAVGRLVPYKGFDRLINAADRLDGDVVIVGDGVSRPALEKLAKDRGVDHRVHLVGRVDDATLLAHLTAASVFALPSWNRAEAFGIVLLEAQAAGLPVVATDVGTGTVEAFAPGETGLKIAPDDEGQLIGALNLLLRDDELAARLGAAGRARLGRPVAPRGSGPAPRSVRTGAAKGTRLRRAGLRRARRRARARYRLAGDVTGTSVGTGCASHKAS